MDDIRRRGNNQNRTPRFSDSPSFRPPVVRPISPQPPQPVNQPTPQPNYVSNPEPQMESDDLWFEQDQRQRQPLPRQQNFPPQQQSIANNDKPKKRRSRRKIWLISLLILLLVGGGATAYWFVVKPRLDKRAAQNAQPPAQEITPKALSGNFRVIATGDMITHDSVNQQASVTGTPDYAPMLTEVKPILEKAQTRICHETVPAAGGAISGYPSFNAPSELIAGLSKSGCNVMSLASDHINDKGQAAIDATVKAVEEQKDVVLSAGANRSAEEQAKERYFNVGDGAVKFAYFSYTTRQANGGSAPFGVNTYDKAKAAADIAKVRSTADFVLVSMCWGKEDSGDIQPEQDQIAQELTDMGADVVFGHCTHVVQPVKQLKSADGARQSYVYYSLGNALSSQLPIETLIGGFAVINIDLATKKITSTGLMPTYMHYDWTAAEKNAKTLNARKNLKLYPLDKAEAQLAASQNGTTAQVQTAKIQEIVNKFTPTKLFTSTELAQ